MSQGGLPLCPEPSGIDSSVAHLPPLELDALRARGRLPPQAPGRTPTCSCPGPQVLPKLSSSIVHEIDSILGNKPYSKKDYRS